MIGMVVVSHSEKLAMGVKELAEQLNDGSVQIEVAGGIEGDIIGTSPVRIQEAIEKLASQKDILVFFDLGSAVMSSEMALELLSEEISKKVRLVNAPLVEGVVAATVQACTTNDIESIIKIAEDSKDIEKI